MGRKATGKPVGRPYETTPAPTKAAERSRQWRLKNLERSRTSAIARHKEKQAI